MGEIIMKARLRANESVELEARVKTVWIVAERRDTYPYFNVIGIHPDEEGALEFACESAAFADNRGFYWKAQEVVWSEKEAEGS